MNTFQRIAFGVFLVAIVLLGNIAGATSFAYVTNYNSNTVSVINTETNVVVATINVGTHPHGIGITPDGSKVYVANSGANTVSVIDARHNTYIDTISVQNTPVGVAVTPSGNGVYVTNFNSNTVSLIDTTTDKVVDGIPVGRGPYGIAVTPGGNGVYVANTHDNSVSLIDTGPNTVVDVIPVGNTPTGIAVTPAGNGVYVTNMYDNTVSLIDTGPNTVVDVIPVGKNPVGIAVTPHGNGVYVANQNDNNVYLIDTGPNTVVDVIPVGREPVGIGITPAGNGVYVSNWGDNTVSLIDTGPNTVVDVIPVGSGPNAFGNFIGPNHVCGNGIVESGEQCDDGNTNSGDGCSATCTVESGYTCSGNPSVCVSSTSYCGDGTVNPGEQCDDGNTQSGDGCSATCTIESGYTCFGHPSVCVPTYPYLYGYQFKNFGRDNLPWSLFENTYGSDAVDIFGFIPIPRPSAAVFYEYGFRHIAKEGSCFGMAASSSVLYQNGLKASDLGLNPNNPLPAWTIFPRFLSKAYDWVEYYHVRQADTACQDDENNKYYNVMTTYNELKRRMSSPDIWIKDPMVLNIYQVNNWGHSVTPTRILESADGTQADVKIYDNNYPNEEHTVHFDLVHGTAYDADYFSEPLSDVNGDSLSSIEAKPEMGYYNWVDLTGHLLFTDSSGNHMGYDQGSFVENIPGAYRVKFVDDSGGPESYYIGNLALKRQLLGATTGIATINIPEPNSLATVAAAVSPTSIDEIQVPPDVSKVGFKSGQGTATLTLTLDKETSQYARVAEVGTSGLSPGSVARVEFTPDLGQVRITNVGPASQYSFTISQIGSNSGSYVSPASILVPANSVLLVTPQNWNDLSGTPIKVTITPSITWSNPPDILYGTALTATQLNAVADVPGIFIYTPPAGTVLNVGLNQNLHVDFTPSDTTIYTGASKDVTINVLKATPTTTLTSTPNPSVSGQSVSFTATVTPTSSVAKTPTGTVTFVEGTTTLGTSTLTSGYATLSTKSLSVGSHSIIAVYNGDSNFATSSSSAITQTVLTPAQAINNLKTAVNNLNIPSGGGLIAKLDAAFNSLAKGNTNAAVNQLNAFINQVNAQSGKQLTVAKANDLIAQVQAIINSI